MKKQLLAASALTLVLPSLSMGALVAWYPLDSDANDASGNGHDGSIVGGGLTFGQAGANGSTGQSTDFAGTGQIDVPWSPALNTSDFTVTLWANAASTGGFASPITNRDDVPLGGYRHGYVIYNNNVGLWSFWNGGGPGANGGWNVADGPAVSTDTWEHIAITYDSATNTKTMYLDGTAVSTTNPVAFSPNNGDLVDGFTHEAEDLHIGAGGDGGTSFWFDGRIDDVGLFRTALTPEEITSIMTNGVGSFGGLAKPLQITDLVVSSGTGNVTITFNSTSGSSYIIERSTNLVDWLELTDDHESEGEVTTYTDPTVPDDTTKLFYRVIRL